jgi:NAD(P)-dependent dehydrogenase (short-subunit alcohol dehydrogenase family)
MAGVALITGSAVRVGREIAFHLAEAGWDLALHYYSSVNEALILEADLKANYPRQQFYLCKASLYSIGETRKLVPNVINYFGKLDLLINNAAIFEPASLKDTSVQMLDRHWQMNCRAPFILINDYASLSGKGMIINIVDSRITKNDSDYLAYTLSKKSLWELTKMAAIEFAPSFRVNAIGPGALLSPAGRGPDYLIKVALKTPMKEPVKMASLLSSIDYLLENESMTGQLLFCDGGAHL